MAALLMAVIFAAQGHQVALAKDCGLVEHDLGLGLTILTSEGVLEAGTTITIRITTEPGAGTFIMMAIVDEKGNPVDYKLVSGGQSLSLTYTLKSNGIVAIMMAAGDLPEDEDDICSCELVPFTYVIEVSGCSGPGALAMNLLDGRFNNVQDKDVAAPVAIYGDGIQIYSIDPETGDGWLDVHITQQMIDEIGVPTDEPVLLGQGTNHYTGIDIFVYRLPTGEFQINTHYAHGTPYVFVWDAEGSRYHLLQ